jgi:probable F420-dependent oxidoreductase
VDVGLFVPTATPFATPEVLAAVGRAADQRGYATLWVPEHVVLFDDYASVYPYSPDGKLPAPPGSGMLDPLAVLAFLAAATSTVRLATGICLLAQRNPVYAAKELATIDHLSGGRLDLGVGVGWLREEYEAVGVPWEGRGRRTDEAIEVLRALWVDDPSSHDGERYHVPECRMHPKPVQQPHPPIHIGGESDAALARVARAGQGWFSCDRTPEQVVEGMARLEAALAAEGRSRAEVAVTVCPYFNEVTEATVDAYAEAGVDQLALMAMAFSVEDVEPTFEALDPLRERAIAHLR